MQKAYSYSQSVWLLHALCVAWQVVLIFRMTSQLCVYVCELSQLKVHAQYMSHELASSADKFLLGKEGKECEWERRGRKYPN